MTGQRRRRFKLRSRLVPVAGFHVACALHPKGGHGIIVYGYARRQKPGEWWPSRWRRLAWLHSSQASTSAHKHIFYKFVDYKRCPHNTRQDQRLHHSLRMLGLPTCRYALQQMQPPAGITLLPTSRATTAMAFLDRIVQRVFPGCEHARLHWSTVHTIVVRVYITYTFQGEQHAVNLYVDPTAFGGNVVVPCEFTIARLPVSISAIVCYIEHFILANA